MSIACVSVILLSMMIGVLISRNTTAARQPADYEAIDAIEKLLPQTQCGDCGFNACRPYAEAIVKHAADINRCLPGGLETVQALSLKTGLVAKPLYKKTDKYEKPRIAFIHEEQCIGCTKCIIACPVDAIIGAPKQMHSIINAHCTGCELCVAPCPVDCISMVAAS